VADIGKCKLCGGDLVNFEYKIVNQNIVKAYVFKGVKCSNYPRCEFKVPKDAKEL